MGQINAGSKAPPYEKKHAHKEVGMAPGVVLNAGKMPAMRSAGETPALQRKMPAMRSAGETPALLKNAWDKRTPYRQVFL